MPPPPNTVQLIDIINCWALPRPPNLNQHPHRGHNPVCRMCQMHRQRPPSPYAHRSVRRHRPHHRWTWSMVTQTMVRPPILRTSITHNGRKRSMLAIDWHWRWTKLFTFDRWWPKQSWKAYPLAFISKKMSKSRKFVSCVCAHGSIGSCGVSNASYAIASFARNVIQRYILLDYALLHALIKRPFWLTCNSWISSSIAQMRIPAEHFRNVPVALLSPSLMNSPVSSSTPSPTQTQGPSGPSSMLDDGFPRSLMEKLLRTESAAKVSSSSRNPAGCSAQI